MIPQFMKFKDESFKYCIICKQFFVEGDNVLVYGNLNTPFSNARYLHIWCVIKYSLKKRMQRRLKESGSKK